MKAASFARDIAILSPTGTNPFDGLSNFVGGAGVSNYPKTTVVVAKLETMRPRDGEEVLAAGFPLGAAALESTTGRIASAWLKENLSTAKVNGSSEVSDVYHLDLRINPGNSGGPLFHTRTQGVLGIVVEVQRSETGNGLAVVVPSKYIAELLTASNQTGVERLRISPIVNPYSTLTNQQLQRVAVDVAEQLRNFQTRMDQERHALDAQFDQIPATKDAEERNKRFRQLGTQQSDLSQRLQREYSSTVGRDVKNVFLALQARLPAATLRSPTAPQSMQDFKDLQAFRTLSTGHIMGDVLAVGDYIERLVKELP